MDHSDFLNAPDSAPTGPHADFLGEAPSFPRGGFAPEGVEASVPVIDELAGAGRAAGRALDENADKAAILLHRAGLPIPLAALAMEPAKMVGALLPKDRTNVVLTAAGFIPEEILGVSGQAAATIAKKLSPEMVDGIARAAAMKIPLSAAEILQSHAASYLEEGLSKLPFSSGMIETFRGLREAAVKDARDNLLDSVGKAVGEPVLGAETQEKVSGVLDKSEQARTTARASERETLLGNVPSKHEIGSDLQREIGGSMAAEKKAIGGQYKDVAKSIPKDRNLFPLDNTRGVASKALESKGGDFPTIDAETASDLKIISDGNKSGKGQTWQKMHDLQSEYGQIAEKARRGGDSIKAGIYRDLKQGVRDDMEAMSKSIGGDTYKKYEQATKSWAAMKGKYGDNITAALEKNPEEFYNHFVGPNKVTQLQELKKVVPDSSLEPIRQKFIEELVGADPNTIPKTSQIMKKMSDYREVIPELLNKGQIKQVQKFAERGEMPQFVQSAVEKRLERVMAQTPDKVFNTVMGGDHLIAKSVKDIVGKAGWEPYRRKMLEKILGESGGDVLNPEQIEQAMDRFTPEFRELFLSPKEMGEINGIKNVQNLFNTSKRLTPTLPGITKQAAVGAGAMEAILNPSVRGAILSHPVTGAATVITPPILAKMYLSETGRRLLTEGVSVSASDKSAMVTAAKIMDFLHNSSKEDGEEPQTENPHAAPDPSTLSPEAQRILQ